MAHGFLSESPIPHCHSVGAPPTKKRGQNLQTKRIKNDVRFIMRCKMMLGSQSDAKIMKKDVKFAFE